LGRGQRLAITMPHLMLHRNKSAQLARAARPALPLHVSQLPPLVGRLRCPACCQIPLAFANALALHCTSASYARRQQ
jgi:hypothetical protein